MRSVPSGSVRGISVCSGSECRGRRRPSDSARKEQFSIFVNCEDWGKRRCKEEAMKGLRLTANCISGSEKINKNRRLIKCKKTNKVKLNVTRSAEGNPKWRGR